MSQHAMTIGELAELLHESPEFLERHADQLLGRHALEYEPLTDAEREQTILQVLRRLDGDLKVSGSHRAQEWQQGWQENLDAYRRQGAAESLVPRYFGKPENRDVARLMGRFVRSAEPGFIIALCELQRTWMMLRFLRGHESVYEFGCGTGWNLLRLAELDPGVKRLVGLDWAESAVNLVNAIGADKGLPLTAKRFDFFHPDDTLEVPPGSAMFTLTALEQVGDGFQPFLDFALSKRFALCVHVEPVIEFYEEDSLFDYLGMRYHTRRNYLGRMLTALRQMEARGLVEIVYAQRIAMGNVFSENVSTIVWRPI